MLTSTIRRGYKCALIDFAREFVVGIIKEGASQGIASPSESLLIEPMEQLLEKLASKPSRATAALDATAKI